MRLNKLLAEIFGQDQVISPSELLHPPFRRSFFGGYKRSDVDSLLKRAADAIETLISHVHDLKTETERQKERLEEYRQIEMTLRNALVSSQQFSENLIAAAKREAELLREEANLQKKQILAEASKLPEQLATTLETLNRQKQRMRQEMLALLDAHRRLLDTLVPEEVTQTPAAFFETETTSSESEMTKTVESPTPNSPMEILSESTCSEKVETMETNEGIEQTSTFATTNTDEHDGIETELMTTPPEKQEMDAQESR
ncbi:MAG TPA: DivIVA domain-containing protein [Candidatus Hydrogenedentes bacterium]|nr:DivIVA domain-containing protein [Candidatus Hydrogenedentota bacterium]HOL75558.1 DivIVA domain-containing protein [Candidatus Hydrogenedentota bacterium]HPO87017.1 DivIVA domain-containing protein [Candidatus Hydrogenedentota bacterium]